MSLREQMDRLDRIAERKVAALEAEERRADEARAAEAREQARADVWRCREIAEIFDDAFRGFGLEPRRRSTANTRHAIAAGCSAGYSASCPTTMISGVRADELPTGKTYLNFEQMVVDAAKLEGERPSVDNLPKDGTLVARTRTDSSNGQKFVEYFGRHSFIADMGRPARRVLNIRNPRDNTVLLGRPLEQAR